MSFTLTFTKLPLPLCPSVNTTRNSCFTQANLEYILDRPCAPNGLTLPPTGLPSIREIPQRPVTSSPETMSTLEASLEAYYINSCILCHSTLTYLITETLWSQATRLLSHLTKVNS